jgi:predicted Zn-dependent protease
MLSKIIDMLNRSESVDEWLVSDKKIESSELFFVGSNLDMNRSKQVRHISVTVYKNFISDGKEYKGSANTKLSPAMTSDEIAVKMEQAALAATFVKNPYYELPGPTDEFIKQVESKFDSDSLSTHLPKIVLSLYKRDEYENGRVNSCEFFLEKIDTRIRNSRGVDEQFSAYKGQIELVVDWKETGEEVEIIEIIDFSDLNSGKIKQIVADTLDNARLRAKAQPMPKLDDIPVLLVKENVNEFLRYYIEKSNVSLVYQKYSDAKIGESLQGEVGEGDRLNITLLPEIEGSVMSRYIDGDGVKLHERELIKDSVLLRYHGDSRHSQYLGVNPTGVIGNVSVAGGSQIFAQFKEDPYLEIRYFSDFQMDVWTGDFGGEIRLAIYHDGENKIPVTGGSIVGNIKDVQSDMLLRRELQLIGKYICPKGIKLTGVTVAG